MPADKKRPAATPAADREGAAPPSFEEAIERLETIVDELESGSLSLEESIARYEEGMRLSKQLTRTLDEAEKRIERLTGEGGEAGPGGKARTEPLEIDLGSPENPSEGKLPF
jgi:exodeoxyribonuclease VII small subunit